MATILKPEWSKPGAILFAAEIPTNERAFAHALAQAVESDAALILFHSSPMPLVGASPGAGLGSGLGSDLAEGVEFVDSAAIARAETTALEPLARRARAAGVQCRVMVRAGLAADQILSAARERGVDRIVMGTHAPGHIGKLLVGSVAESVLRRAPVPVCIVGPEAERPPETNFVANSAANSAPRTILCAVSRLEGGGIVAAFAAEMASRIHARLVLLHVIRPQDCKDVLASHCLAEIEAQLLALVPARLRQKVHPRPVVVPGDPTEEVLYQSRSQNAELIVMGAHGASAFAAVTRHGVVYKALAAARCPVITLSPAVLEAGGGRTAVSEPSETYLAGVI
jgi:nucleotide-binding universal stress UspA family protein